MIARPLRLASVRSLALAAGLVVFAACAAPGAVDSRVDPIVDGTLETGRPEVVFMYRLDGAACTGSIIAPRVVLTANHCVEGSNGVPAPASYFRIYVGSSQRSLTAEYRVSEVRPVPNAGLGREANDVALLILTQVAAETPLMLARTSPAELFNQQITAVGFGQIPGGNSGTKYTTQALVNGYQGGFVLVEPAVCPGDSGGPLIGPNGMVYGVASFIFSPDGRTEPSCGTAPGAYNEIYRHLAFIDSVLVETGTCVMTDEVCDGEDNDCDEQVDEGCLALGAPCAANEECTGGLCAETSIGRVCTAECDPLRPEQGCSPGYYCGAASGCDGFCLPGTAGELPLEADCTADTDCHSLLCLDPGDGRPRCLAACRGDAGMCLAGEACAASPGACGGCVPTAIIGGDHGLGEPCEADTQCRDGMVCQDLAGVRECARPCTGGADSDECGELFTCRDGFCTRDHTQGVGGVCVGNGDCGGGICAAQGGRSWCTATCNGPEECPMGFVCVAAGGAQVCAPSRALDGEGCEAHDDCASGTCAEIGSGGFCTSFCDADDACAAGFECERVDGLGANVCRVAAPLVEERDGCSVSPGRSSRAASPLLLALALLALLFRRRARSR